jgi:predicted TIM-barrel fold metal-dependent hydrolase
MSYLGPIIDSHVHFWDPRTTPRTVSPVVKLLGWNERLLHSVGLRLFPKDARNFVGIPNHVMRAYLPSELAHEQRDVNAHGFVHVQAGWHGRGELCGADETRWLESLGDARIRGIVGQATLESPSLARLIAAHRAASPRFVGVRDMTAHDPDPAVMAFSTPDRMKSTRFRRGLVHLGDVGLSFDAWCYGPQLRDLADALAEARHTRVVLCHLGTPIGIGGPYGRHGTSREARASIFARWKDDIARIAEMPNVHAKLSGLAMPILGFGFHRRPNPPSSAELADCFGPLIEHAFRTFGTKRCFFGSNFPMDKVSATWPTIFRAFESLTRDYDDATRRGLFHDHAAHFYRLSRS